MSDISEIESKIKKLREEANKRAVSLINTPHASQKIVAGRGHVLPEKATGTQSSEALAAKQRLLRQARREEAIRDQLKEKNDALSKEVDVLEARIRELSLQIAERDEQIAALTAEKVQWDESFKIAEESARDALETSDAWQRAATEEISAHAVTAMNRDSLLTEVEQLECDVERYDEALQRELDEQEQAASVQIERLKKELEYYSRKTVFRIKDISIDGCESNTDASRPVPAAEKTGMVGEEQKTSRSTVLHEPAPANNSLAFSHHLPLGNTDLFKADASPVLKVNILDNAYKKKESISLAFPQAPDQVNQPGKNQEVAGQNIKNNQDLNKYRPTCDLGERPNDPVLYSPRKRIAKAWQNKVEEFSAISDNGSIRWDRRPEEGEGTAGRAETLEFNVRKLAELSMTGAHAESRPAGSAANSGAEAMDENQVGAGNNAVQRKRVSVAAGVGTVAIAVFLMAGLSIAARDGATFIRPLGDLFGKLQPGALNVRQGQAFPDAGDHKSQPRDLDNGSIKQKPAAVSANDTLGAAVVSENFWVKP
ncbi:hypothetical protein [Candidatus Methylospira mobilis]|nr:hypothetical protein [Candidatus Methylospira mobilis]